MMGHRFWRVLFLLHTHHCCVPVLPPLPLLGDSSIRLWAISPSGGPPELSHTLTSHTESVCSLAISKDGAYLYSGSDDRSEGAWGRGEPG